jgi:hypothetical protein
MNELTNCYLIGKRYNTEKLGAVGRPKYSSNFKIMDDTEKNQGKGRPKLVASHPITDNTEKNSTSGRPKLGRSFPINVDQSTANTISKQSSGDYDTRRIDIIRTEEPMQNKLVF